MPKARRPLEAAKTPLQQFGRELRFRRESAGMSVAQLAQAVGRDRRTITSAEDGRDCPSAAIVYELEQQLHSQGLLISYYEAVVASRQRARLNMNELHNGMSPDAADDDVSIWLDETVPDGTIMLPGERFEKTWTIRNAGSRTWTGRRLSRMGIAAGPGLITTPGYIDLPTVAPGEDLVVVVPCVAQFVQGTSLAAFKMTDGQKRLYFDFARYSIGLQVQITVVERMRSDSDDSQ